MIHVESRHVYTLVSQGYDTPGRSSSATLQSTSSITATTPTLSASSASPRPPRERRVPRRPRDDLLRALSDPIAPRRFTNLRRGAFQRRRDLFVIDGVHTPSLAKMSARGPSSSPLSAHLRHGETPDGRRHLVSERAREEDAGKPRVSQEEPLGTNLGVASRSAPPRGDSSSGVLQTRAFRPGAMVERELLRVETRFRERRGRRRRARRGRRRRARRGRRRRARRGRRRRARDTFPFPVRGRFARDRRLRRPRRRYSAALASSEKAFEKAADAFREARRGIVVEGVEDDDRARIARVRDVHDVADDEGDDGGRAAERAFPRFVTISQGPVTVNALTRDWG